MSCKFVCLKWGSKYSNHYVNRLYRGVYRNSNITEFHCLTDDYRGIDENIICHPLPDVGMDLEGWWWKISMFNPNYYQQLQGEVLYLDLDMVITDDINPMIEVSRVKDIISIKDPWLDGMNSSVMRWNRSEMGWVWDKFVQTQHVGRPRQYYEMDGKVFAGDQDYLNYVIQNKQFYPDHWVLGWKAHGKSAVIDRDPRIVMFNGKPDPHELVEEVGWIRKFWS